MKDTVQVNQCVHLGCNNGYYGVYQLNNNKYQTRIYSDYEQAYNEVILQRNRKVK